MDKTAAAMVASSSRFTTPVFWERLWRSAGIQSVGLLLVACVAYRFQPLIAAVICGFAVLNFMWFAAAIRTTLADAGQYGWGAATTASSAAAGALFFLLIAVAAALAYSTPGSSDGVFAAGIDDFMWGCFVMSSFPRAMLIMSASFGLWRSRLISNEMFAACVAVIVLVLLGGTTWMSDGIWAPDGVYSRFVSPVIGIVWILVVSRVVLAQSPGVRAGW